VTYCNIHSPYGHDAFLLEVQELGTLISGFLNSTFQQVQTGRTILSSAPAAAADKPHSAEHSKHIRIDYERIDSLIEPGSRVLDLGCGDGELLVRLIQDKNVIGQGIEIDEDLVIHCIQRGLSVIHQDIEKGLEEYPADRFDYAILSQTIQTLRDPEKVLRRLLRIAKKVIVSFPNFAHWKCRFQLFFKGQAPQTRQLPYRWYNSPNIHFLSIKDFDRFCTELGIQVEEQIPLRRNVDSPLRFWPNLLAEQAVYVLSKYQS